MSTQRGSVSKRNGNWGYRFSYTNDKGERKWKSVMNKLWTQKDAQRELTSQLAKIDAGHTLGTARGTVADFLSAWFDTWSKSGNVKQTTIDTTRAHINAYLIPRIGAMQLRELKPARISALYVDLLNNGRTGYKRAEVGKPLSPKTVRNIAGTLHKALSDGVRLGVLPANPADHVDRPRYERPDLTIWDSDQVGIFLAHCYANNDSMYALWRLALLHGLRRGELLGLRWSDVDFIDSAITIRQTRVQSWEKGTTIGTPKTHAGRRSMSIDAGTIDALAALKDQHEHATARLGTWSGDLVATDLDGNQIHPRTITRRFQATALAAGLPVIRLHDARHTSATKQLQDGLPVHLVSARLGHSRSSTTLDTYAHALPAADRALANALGASIDEAMRRAQNRL